MTLSYRQALPDEADGAARIIDVALADLVRRQGRNPPARPDGLATPALRHLVDTREDRVFVAVDDDRPVGFGAGMLRGRLRYCSGLFVLPEWQGRGLGRRLFELAMEEDPAAARILALTSSAANPVSNALYARHGVYPQLALLYLSGPPPLPSPAGRAPRRAAGLEFEPLDRHHLTDLRGIDHAVLGIDRTPDHEWFLGAAARPGWLVRRRGRAVGYAYLGGDGAEGAGAVGPVATLRPQDQVPALDFVLSELAATGVERATVAVPGSNLHAQRLLWDSGFTFPAATGLFCASRPFGRFDRYLLAGDCLM